MDLDARLREAMRLFWTTRDEAKATGKKDDGLRAGKHLDALSKLLCGLLVEAGVKRSCLYCRREVEVPGFFRATKQWDMLVVAGGRLFAAIECKSISGGPTKKAFGKNLNNRTEEAIGNAIDLLVAHRKGALHPSPRPWLGYLIIIEDHSKSRGPVDEREPHFPVLPEFRQSSYIERARLLLQRLQTEPLYEGSPLYDRACLIASEEQRGEATGVYREPDADLTFKKFAESLVTRATTVNKLTL